MYGADRPWSYDPGHPDPQQRWREWPDGVTPPAVPRPRWPDEPRHHIRAADPAGEAARIGAELIAGLTAIVRDALARLDELDDEGGRW